MNSFILDEQEIEQDNPTEAILSMPEELSVEESLRLQMLILSKEILLGKSAMKWETHKQYEDVSVLEIIEEAQKMFEFVRGRG